MKELEKKLYKITCKINNTCVNIEYVLANSYAEAEEIFVMICKNKGSMGNIIQMNELESYVYYDETKIMEI